MRSKPLLKMTSAVLLICLLLTATPAPSFSAEQGLFFNYSTALRIYSDLKFAREDAADQRRRLGLCGADRKLADEQIGLLQQKAAGLEKDKAEYRKEADQFQALYVKTDQERVVAVNAAPSRLRWFCVGAATTMAVILGFFIRQK